MMLVRWRVAWCPVRSLLLQSLKERLHSDLACLSMALRALRTARLGTFARRVAARGSAKAGAAGCFGAAALGGAAVALAWSPPAQAASMTENRILGDRHRVGITAWALRDPRAQPGLDETAKSFRSPCAAALFLRQAAGLTSARAQRGHDELA